LNLNDKSAQNEVKWEKIDIVSVALLFTSPWPSEAFDARFMICVTNNGALWGYRLNQTLTQQLRVPPPFVLQDSLVSHQQSVLVSAPFMASLLAHSNVPQQWITKNHPWPLSGGLPPEANADKQTLLITAQTKDDGPKLRFWDATTSTLQLLYTIHMDPDVGGLLSFQLCERKKIVAAYTSKGTILLYDYREETTTQELWLYDPQGLRKIAETVDQHRGPREYDDDQDLSGSTNPFDSDPMSTNPFHPQFKEPPGPKPKASLNPFNEPTPTPTPAQKEQNKPALPPPAFHIGIQIQWPAGITALKMETGLNRLAFGDCEGRLTVFDISTSPGLLFSKVVFESTIVRHIHFIQISQSGLCSPRTAMLTPLSRALSLPVSDCYFQQRSNSTDRPSPGLAR